MPGFRRPTRVPHVVHPVELPSLGGSRARFRRLAAPGEAGERGAPLAPRFRAVGGGLNGRAGGGANGTDRGAVVLHPGRRGAVSHASSAGADPALAPDANAARVELLERRVAKLSKLLDERTAQLQLRLEQSQRDPGVASLYSEVQGISPEAIDPERKREMMAAIFEANRKHRERIGLRRRDAE